MPDGADVVQSEQQPRQVGSPDQKVDTPRPEQQKKTAGAGAAALELLRFGDILFPRKDDPAGTKVAKEYTQAAVEQVKQISVLQSELMQSNTEIIKAAQLSAESAMEQVSSMRAELEALRRELAESKELADVNTQKLLATEVGSLRRDSASESPRPVLSQSFSSVPPVPTIAEIKERRKAELEAVEEFAFAGRAIGLPSRLRTAGYSCIEARAAGYTFADARAAGYSLAEAAEAEYAEAREALTSGSRRESVQEYTPFELANGQEHNEESGDEGEEEMPSPNELVKRWQSEVPALRGRSLSKQQTQSLSMVAEMLTGDVDCSEEKKLGGTSPVDVTTLEGEMVRTPEKSNVSQKRASLDMMLAESPS